MMRKEELIQKLQAMKRNASTTSEGERLRQINKEVYSLMDLLMLQRIQSSGAAEAINGCYEGLFQDAPTDPRQVRTDILFSIKICLDIVRTVRATVKERREYPQYQESEL